MSISRACHTGESETPHVLALKEKNTETRTSKMMPGRGTFYNA